MDRTSVIIVGGGFSGTMVATHLAGRGIDSVVIDDSPRPATGAAYATDDATHVLNVRASSMSAFPDRPNDFADRVAGAGVAPGGFARRRDYRRYLNDIFAEAEASGLVTRRPGTVTSARPLAGGWSITLADGRTLIADQLVLATGNPPPAPLPAMAGVAEADRIDQPWQPEAADRLARAALSDEPVLIVGTGLTMVDTLLTLEAAGHRGPITALSRHGLVPHGHVDGIKSMLDPVAVGELPTTIRGLSRWLRARSAADSDWRVAIDALRPVTHPLWQALGAAEQRRFLRHARAFWDIHRHRIAPTVAATVAAMRARGQLTVLAGHLLGSAPTEEGYRFTYRPRGGAAEQRLTASLLVNATGPAQRFSTATDPVLAQLRDEGLATGDAIDLGIALDDRDRIAGHANAWAIGPVARGNYWEMTAVPDLSGKAADLAGRIADAVEIERARAA